MNENTKLPKEIWLKVINLINDLNYKISLFSYYIIQLLEPREEITFFEFENYNNTSNKNPSVKFIKGTSDDKFHLKLKSSKEKESLSGKETNNKSTNRLIKMKTNSKRTLKNNMENSNNIGDFIAKNRRQLKLQLLNEEELERLHLLIRDKIILETKNKTLENNNNGDNYYLSQNTINEMRIKSPKSPKNQNIDEINDYMDLVKIPELTGFYDEVDESK